MAFNQSEPWDSAVADLYFEQSQSAQSFPSPPYINGVRPVDSYQGLLRRINGTESMPSSTSSYASESERSEAEGAFAILSFADRTYYIKSKSVVIGRSAQRYLPLSRQAPTTNKRKRSNSTDGSNKRQCAYPGGIGPHHEGESTAPIPWNSTQRVDVFPPTDSHGEPSYPKSMSKDHLELTWNDQYSKWSLKVLGRNGVFLSGTFLPQYSQVLIEDGLTIDMGHVEFDFMDQGEEKASRSYLSNSEDAGYETDEDEHKPVAPIDMTGSEDSRPSSSASATLHNTTESARASTEAPLKAKRARPGRPPADGVMSKAERKKREKCAKDNIPYVADVPARSPTKSKAKDKGRADPPNPTEDHDDRESPDASGTKAKDGEKSQSPTRKPQRSKSEFTAAQLEKPQETYKDLLYYVLKEQTRPISFLEVYDCFMEKWPHFLFQPTDGWQSSIRHQTNGSGPEYLKQDGKKGKGRTLQLDPSVKYETKAEKLQREKKANQALVQAHSMSHAQQASYPPQHHPGYGPMPASQFVPRSGAPQPHDAPVQAYQPNAPMNQHAVTGQSIPGAHPTNSNGYRPQPPATIYGAHPSMPAQRANQQPPARSNVSQQPQPRSSQPGPTAARSSTTPATPSSEQQKKVRELKRRVFENFRACLINLAQDQANKLRYQRLMNDAINHACQQPDNTEYTGPDPTGDLKKITNMLWISWGTQAVNPRSANYDPKATVPAAPPIANNPGVAHTEAPQQGPALSGGPAPAQASAPLGEVNGA